MNKSRVALLALAALIVLTAGFLVAWQAIEGIMPTPAARPRTTWTGLSAPTALAEAEGRARGRAEQWAADAELLRAEATWRPPEAWVQADHPPVAWSFYYYSPAQGEVASASVDGEELFWITPTAVDVRPATLQSFPPQHGVDVAWLSFRASGGEEFLEEHPNAAVHFRLQQEEASYWTVMAFDQEANLRVKISADTGLVVTP
jgi:hypothetical protein